MVLGLRATDRGRKSESVGRRTNIVGFGLFKGFDDSKENRITSYLFFNQL